jgi:hypothetical protein
MSQGKCGKGAAVAGVGTLAIPVKAWLSTFWEKTQENQPKSPQGTTQTTAERTTPKPYLHRALRRKAVIAQPERRRKKTTDIGIIGSHATKTALRRPPAK